VPYFSGDEKDPDRRGCQSEMEDLSRHAQGLLCFAMEDVLRALPPAELVELTRFVQKATHGVRKWRRRLRLAQQNQGK
jgi:hypothetical protein